MLVAAAAVTTLGQVKRQAVLAVAVMAQMLEIMQLQQQ
tara:strand:+ start:628 stop:741 length:114 start_codon:yes stop_codon:yes gene_type:complete